VREQTVIIPKGGVLTRIVSLLSALAADTPLKVTIAEYKRTRSHEQNAYLWGVVYKTVCDHLEGWSADDVHEYCLGECFGWETLEGFGRRRLRPVRRSAKLSTTEFSDYVAFIQRRMSEHGIYIVPTRTSK
jgi:hypothetical protein